MEAVFTKKNDCLVVIPEERLDTNNAPAVEKKLTEKIQAGELRIIFDFCRTEYVSSAGLRVILVALKLLKPQQGTMVLCNANEQILEVLEMSGFHNFVQHLNSFDEAVQSLCP